MSSHAFTKKILGNMVALISVAVPLLVPTVVSAQTDKPKPAPSAPARTAPAPTRPSRQAPAQQSPPRQVQQPPAQQAPPRQAQQPPAQQAPPRQWQQYPGQRPPVDNPQAPNAGRPERRGITGQPSQSPNTNGQERRGITGQPSQSPNTSGQERRGITGQPSQTPNVGGQERRGITGQPSQAPNTGGWQRFGSTGQPSQTPNMGGQERRGITGGGRSGGGFVYHTPSGVQTTRQPDGTQVHVDPRTRTMVHTDPAGRITTLERPGLRASGFREDGRAAHIEAARPDGSTLVVNRGFRGDRRVEVVHPGGVRVVAVGRQAFVERQVRTGYVSRTYVVGGRTEVRVYRNYTYNSVRYVTYVPRVYYQPAFYGWAARPWGPRVAYSWGWEPAAPWFYGGYFAPEPTYSTPALWLTDFLLAENLRLAYDNQQQRYQDQQSPPQMAQGNDVVLTTEIKMQIAEEVTQQLAAEQAATTQTTAAPQAGNGADVPPPALRQRVFVVSTSLDVTGTNGGQPCALSAGDIIERLPEQPITSDGKVAINVMSSKPGDCPANFGTQLNLATLQDMQNQFREQLASGMESLASNQGKRLPAGPPAGSRLNPDGQAPPNPTNDLQSRDLVAKLNLEADQTEAEIRKTAGGGQ